MDFTWVDDQRLARACPLCGRDGDQPVVIQYHAPYLDRPLRRLLRCQGCQTLFLDDLTDAPHIEDSENVKHHIAFYVELHAGIDVMLDMLYKVDLAKVGRYLEIGCGFGFSVDFAARRLGWEVRGIDGGIMARIGAGMLGVDIRSDYVTADYDFGGRGFDLILCSEVIEHIADPKQFLALLPRVLAPGGALILTTPDARLVRRDTGGATLLQILTPGFHLVLFTPETLERALREAGFAFVEVWQKEATLCAVAAAEPVRVRREATVPLEPYAGYLEQRAAIEAAPSPLSVGLLYRLLKARTMAIDADGAEAAFRDLAQHCRTVYRLDLERPESLGLDRLPPLHFYTVTDHLPYCLGCILHHRGVGLARDRRDPVAALAYFRAAALAAAAIKEAMLTVGLDDGDNETALWLSWVLGVAAMAESDPDAVRRALKNVGEGREPGNGLWPIADAYAAKAKAELFVRLINAGRFDAAGELAPWVATLSGPAPGGIDPTSMEALNALYCLGQLRLHHQGEGKAATEAFSAVADGTRRRLAQGYRDGPLLDLSARARVSLVVAAAAVDPKAAIAKLQELRRAPAAGESATAPDQLSAEGLSEARDEVFVRLVNSGAHAMALRLADEVWDDGRLDEVTRSGSGELAAELLAEAPIHLLNALFCLAILKLNYQLLPEPAARIFAAVHYACRGKLRTGRDREAATGLLWDSGYNRVFAYKVAGQAKPMQAAAKELLAPPTDLPPIPERVAESVQSLVA